MSSGPRVDRAERLIDAPPGRVFAAWSDADVLVCWLPPEGATAEITTFDFRPGGALQMVLHFAPGTDGKAGPARDEVRGSFAAIHAPHHIALDVEFPSDDPTYGGVMRMDWTFAAAGTGTRASVAASNVPPGISPDDHARGLASSLANLARVTSQTKDHP